PSSMRYPRILTCSSTRPRYRSCPSAPQHTRSPVRYIRVPGAPAPPNGQATYNSPTTPAGTARNHPSSTNNAAPATGDPIGGTPEPALSGALLDAHTVVSVGP